MPRLDECLHALARLEWARLEFADEGEGLVGLDRGEVSIHEQLPVGGSMDELARGVGAVVDAQIRARFFFEVVVDLGALPRGDTHGFRAEGDELALAREAPCLLGNLGGST